MEKRSILRRFGSGFTLIELVVVIIIIGVLASLALPRMVVLIDRSRAAEAFAMFTSIRAEMERCYLMHDGAYSDCMLLQNWDFDPNLSPGRHFLYTMQTYPGTLFPEFKDEYWIQAQYIIDGIAQSAHSIYYHQDGNFISTCGSGYFEGVGHINPGSRCP